MAVVVEREEEQAEVEQEVSALELFFDLVFVFAITQVTGFVAHDATWTRFAEGLAVPHAFDDDALVFGLAYFAVRAAHIGAYMIVSRDDPQLRAVVLRLASTVFPAAALIIAAGVVDGGDRTA